LELVGALHVHSIHSDGSGTVREIALAAREAGLDFVILQDHDSLAARSDVGSGFVEGVFMGVGAEVSPPRNHYLAFGVNELPSRDLPPQSIVDRVNAGGGFGFLAHPMDIGSRVLRLPSYAWTALDVQGYTGLEVWNMMSDWISLTQTIPRTLRVLRHPERHLRGPSPELLALWDRLNRERFVPGVAGQDLHAYRAGPLTVFPYRRSFGMVLMHVRVPAIPGDPAAYGAALLTGIREGRSYFANHALKVPDRFSFTVGRGAPGDHVRLQAGLSATVTPQGEAVFRLIHDGRALPEPGPSWPVAESGSYRVEGRLQGRPWLFTNPIRVLASSGPDE